MSSVLLVCATRYGATKTVCSWIAERLRMAGHDACVCPAEEMRSPDGFNLIILASGIYGHRFLASMDSYIKQHQDILQNKNTALAGVAMRTETFFKGGRAYGGAVMLDRYGAMLGKGCIMGKILGGEMVFDRLSDIDKEGLERFYDSIRLTDSEKIARRAPRTLLNKKECWDFAESAASCL